MRVASFLLILAAALACSAAEPTANEQTLSEADRAELVDLPRKFRAAADFEARQKVAHRAKELGEMGMARLRPLVSKQLASALTRYEAAFSQAAAQLVQANPQLSAQEVRDLEQVSQQRANLLEWGTLADLVQLAPAAAPPDAEQVAAAVPFAEKLQKLEEDGVEHLRTLASLQSLDEVEQATFKLLNLERSKHRLPPLAIDPQLCTAAKLHSHDMQKYNFFSHTSPIAGKSSFGDRARLAGTSASAENIAQAPGAEEVVKMWMNSEGHRANILNPQQTRIGIGRAGKYFTTVFGR